VDAVGLILVPASRRALGLAQAADLRALVPPFVQSVALLLDPEPAWVEQVISVVKPDLLQFHGRERGAFCAQFSHPYIKALSGQQPGDLLSSAQEFKSARGVLIDAHEPGAVGGLGRTFDWSMLPSLPGAWTLSGGLDAENVADAIIRLRPFAVDTASGIESSPGQKSAARMLAFVAAVRAADRIRESAGNPLEELEGLRSK